MESEMPAHPEEERLCPFVNIDSKTLKILRVVVTVLQTNGSNVATV